MSLHPWVITSGILGNVISFMVYLAPLPTFVRVYQKKSTEGFESVPYVVALLSSTLWVYYASLKPNAFLVLTINSIGCFIESIYILFFLVYAPKKPRLFTLKLLLLFNVGGVLTLLLVTHFLAKGSKRVKIVGWSCVALSASVFAAPLSVIRVVIRTKSVEYLPLSLSFFLSLNAVSWFIYGLLLKDLYVAIPNVLGLVFGVIQMGLYVMYKKPKKVDEEKTTAVLPADDQSSEIRSSEGADESKSSLSVDHIVSSGNAEEKQISSDQINNNKKVAGDNLSSHKKEEVIIGVVGDDALAGGHSDQRRAGAAV